MQYKNIKCGGNYNFESTGTVLRNQSNIVNVSLQAMVDSENKEGLGFSSRVKLTA